MKTHCSLLFLVVLPLYVAAQNDYCPCKDKTRLQQEDEMTQLLNAINKQVQQKMPPIILASAPVPQEPEPVLLVEKEPDPEPEPIPEPKVVVQTKKAKTARKTVVGKRVKRIKGRMKKRKKTRKYRGNCPSF